jgi:hypothetical protein
MVSLVHYTNESSMVMTEKQTYWKIICRVLLQTEELSKKRGAGHFFGLFKTHHFKQGGGNICQNSFVQFNAVSS